MTVFFAGAVAGYLGLRRYNRSRTNEAGSGDLTVGRWTLTVPTVIGGQGASPCSSRESCSKVREGICDRSTAYGAALGPALRRDSWCHCRPTDARGRPHRNVGLGFRMHSSECSPWAPAPAPPPPPVLRSATASRLEASRCHRSAGRTACRPGDDLRAGDEPILAARATPVVLV
jgi:hypothetical protein